MSAECDHVWRFQSVVFWFGRQLPGSSATERILGDRYYCERCLETTIRNERKHGNSYNTAVEGTMPR